MFERFSTAGLANSAADARTAETGERWQMAFRPRRALDLQPFTIEKAANTNRKES